MRLPAIFTLAFTLLIVAGAPACADTLADFNAGYKALEEKRYDMAIGLFTKVIRSGEIAGEDLGKVHFNRGLSYELAGEPVKAFEDYRTCTDLWIGGEPGYHNVVRLGVRLGRFDEARKALLVLLDNFRDGAKERTFDLITLARNDQLQGRWREADDLLLRYSSIDPDNKPVDLARARGNVALGASASAIALVRKLDNLYAAILTRADRGFESVWNDPAFLTATDVPAMLARDLAVAQGKAETEVDKLDSVIGLMGALRRAGRIDEAIALGERTLAPDLSRFTDRGDMEVWVYDELAHAARTKGDLAAAERAYRTGVERVGDANPAVVNILINGGNFFAENLGKYREAIQFAERARKVGASAYGDMQVNYVLVVAYWGLKRQDDFARVLAEMEKNAADDASAVANALLLAGRVDDAARLVAGELAHPRGIDSMLLELQHYTLRPVPAGAAGKAIDKGWDALRRHPVVLAALDKVGRITDVPAAGYY